jgi:hypothetical protein
MLYPVQHAFGALAGDSEHTPDPLLSTVLIAIDCVLVILLLASKFRNIICAVSCHSLQDYNEAFGMCCGFPIEGESDAAATAAAAAVPAVQAVAAVAGAPILFLQDLNENDAI